MIHWNEYPLNVVTEILRRDLKVDGEIIPRAQKSDDEKISRTRSIAEVFTPVAVVKEMVDAFELENIFWQTRVDSKCLEVACGEAPFITTRYDAESGEEIPVNQRVGILDRKFQAVPDVFDKNFWATRAVQSCYGYELQADSLLIARANVLLSFVEFVEDFSAAEIREVAEIISKNFWLMDGLKIPDAQASLFDTNEIKITDWLTGDNFFFTGGTGMKFDFLISNPPYQDDTNNGNNRMQPLYHHFMNAAPKVAEKSVLITPARFLFDAGQTPKDFNRRMLDDPHLKVLDYSPDARKYFRNVDIEGGVVVTLYDKTKNFGAIGTFTAWQELNSIHQKICVDNLKFKPLSKIAYTPIAYKFSGKFFADCPELLCKLQKPDDNALRTNIFERLPEIFLDSAPDNEYTKIFGKVGTERVYKFIRREYITAPELLDKYKVFVPESNGASGKLVDNEEARIISKPVIGEPNEGCTQTFITVGAFDTRAEAEACIAYIKSKFCRAMLGILKATQHNPPATWAKVPLQDFTSASDIDWCGDIDRQLFGKYNLSDAEINFIESHVKEMS